MVEIKDGGKKTRKTEIWPIFMIFCKNELIIENGQLMLFE